MALQYFYKDIPLTAKYIDRCERPGHHNYVVESKFYNNASSRFGKVVADMDSNDLKHFDESCLFYLIALDKGLEVFKLDYSEGFLIVENGTVTKKLDNKKQLKEFKSCLIKHTIN